MNKISGYVNEDIEPQGHGAIFHKGWHPVFNPYTFTIFRHTEVLAEKTLGNVYKIVDLIRAKD